MGFAARRVAIVKQNNPMVCAGILIYFAPTGLVDFIVLPTQPDGLG